LTTKIKLHLLLEFSISKIKTSNDNQYKMNTCNYQQLIAVKSEAHASKIEAAI
jgi:hypothetical protein